MYAIIHYYDVDGGFGDAIAKEETLGYVDTEEQAKEYVAKYSKPEVYDTPYAPLMWHELGYEKVNNKMLDLNKNPFEDDLFSQELTPEVKEEKNRIETLEEEIKSLNDELANITNDDVRWSKTYDSIIAKEDELLEERHKEMRELAEKEGALTCATYFETYKGVHLSLNRYIKDNSPCVDLWNEEDGPFARLTTCLSNKKLDKNYSYIDENNCPWAMDFIEAYNLGRNTGGLGFSGYCVYPIVEWNMDELAKWGGKE